MLETRPRLLRVLWLALMLAPVVYLAVATVVITQRGGGVVSAGPALRPALILVGLGLGVLAVVLGRRQLGPRTLAAGRPALRDVLDRYQRALIVCWAIDDGIGVVGLLAALLTGNLRDAAPLVAGALLLAAVAHRPSRDILEEALRIAASHGGAVGPLPRG